jgi:hypothetical protein
MIEIKVMSSYPRFQPQELLDAMQLRDRVFDQEVAVHDKDLWPLEYFQPPEKESVIQ